MSSFSNSAVALCIFLFVAINFLFPCNRVFPFDRRTTSVLGAVMCYISRTGIDNLHAVNFDVMILLSSIMVVNHLVIHLKETKDVIAYMQQLVQDNPIRGLWVIALAAYLTSPFLTNDGVCLLFVEPILKAFEHAPVELTELTTEDATSTTGRFPLRKADAIYFLLALACSANIGSALTYTGNPQNMIVSSDAIGVMPSYKFLIYMLPASLFSWVITMKWIQRCWLKSREHLEPAPSAFPNSREGTVVSPIHQRKGQIELRSMNGDSERSEPGTPNTDVDERALLKSHGMRPEANILSSLFEKFDSYLQKNTHNTELIISPRRKLALEKLKNNPLEKFFVVSPLPYAVLVLLGAMIVMIFVNVLPISGIVCLFAVLMIVAVALGNHLRGQQCWVPEPVEGEEAFSPNSKYRHADASAQAKTRPVEAAYTTVETGENGHEREALTLEAVPADDLGPLTREDEVDNLNRFFEALYGSIDYNLLLIFLGLFIVIDNLSFTGIPRFIWNKIVGNSPFHTFGSVLGISAFVLFTSQFLGNVPVIQLAKPNVEGLDDNTKRLAWAILSFVATVGGNLTLTGSAANIIVTEKATRLDASMGIDFFRHYRVCFWITMLSCVVGALMITAIVVIDNATGSNW